MRRIFILALALAVADSLLVSLKRVARSHFTSRKFSGAQVVKYRLLHPSLSVRDDTVPEEQSFDDELPKSPLEDFLHALEESIKEETLLKLTLSENEYVDSDADGEITDNDGDKVSIEDDSGPNINWLEIKEWAAISGRLIKSKSKSESKLQLVCYKDKSMKKSDQSRNYSTTSEVLPLVSAYIRKAFKKAMLSTKDNDFEIKLRKGQGKFKVTSKVTF